MVARKEAATHTYYTPALSRGQGPASQKHTLMRLSAAAAVRAGARRVVAVVAAAACIAFEGAVHRQASTNFRQDSQKDRPPPAIQFPERLRQDRSPLGSLCPAGAA